MSSPRPSTDRRDFLRRTALAAGALAVPLPNDLLADARLAGGVRAPAAVTEQEFSERTISDLAEMIRSGRATSRGIVEAHLAAIERFDRDGPAINSVLEVNPDALEIAAALDREAAERGPRGPLHGLPVLIKDNIETADRLHTSAGSLALKDHRAARDSGVAERLRAAGAVLIGKSNMSEWANARGRDSIGGWSSRGGLTRNPYALDRSTGGSSSGTAAAVAASICVAAVGTETMGSIVTPSSLCGVVGLRPTVGLTSRAGVIPVSLTQDTTGPITRNVRDAAILLGVLAGEDPRDPATRSVGRPEAVDYTRFLAHDGLVGARIGIARNLFGLSLPADRVVERALAEMQAAGAVLIEDANVETAEAVWTFDSEVLAYELNAALDAYLRALPPGLPVHSLKELIGFNLDHSDEELGWFGQETFEYAVQKGPLSEPGYQTALAMVRQLARADGIDATIARHRLDAIVAPTQSPAWLADALLGDNTRLGSFVTSAAAGYPAITVPAGDVLGLPVGMLVMGPAWSEATLLRIAYAFEQRVRARRAPTFPPTIRLRP